MVCDLSQHSLFTTVYAHVISVEGFSLVVLRGDLLPRNTSSLSAALLKNLAKDGLGLGLSVSRLVALERYADLDEAGTTHAAEENSARVPD
jgi:hypothetical protein